MFRIATETALLFVGEDDESFVIDCDLLTGSGLVGKDSSTEEVEPAVGSVHSFSIIFGIIEHVAIDFILSFIFYNGFIEADSIGIVVDGSIFA